MKTEGEINTSFESIRSGQSPLEKWLWVKAVSKLYNQEERERIEIRIYETIDSKKAANKLNKSDELEEGATTLRSRK
jgi:hypothetical protein